MIRAVRRAAFHMPPHNRRGVNPRPTSHDSLQLFPKLRRFYMKPVTANNTELSVLPLTQPSGELSQAVPDLTLRLRACIIGGVEETRHWRFAGRAGSGRCGGVRTPAGHRSLDREGVTYCVPRTPRVGPTATQVEFYYRPRSVKLGVFLSLLSLASAALFAGRTWSRRACPPPRPQSG